MREVLEGIFTGVVLSALAAGTPVLGGDPQKDTPSTQIHVTCQLLEMSPATVVKLFGAKGGAPGVDVSDELLQRLAKEPGVDVLSAPSILARAGAAAQIRVAQERKFVTGFKVVGTNSWEPAYTQYDLGIKVTIEANPYPQDPERIRGAAEVSISELKEMTEQTVIPPGQTNPIVLQSPLIQTRQLAITFDVRSGKTTVFGGIDKTDGGKATTTLFLLKIETQSSAPDLVAKLKGMVLSQVEFQNTSLNEVVNQLMRHARETDPGKKGINIVIEAGKEPDVDGALKALPTVTLSLRNVSMYDALRFIVRATGAQIEYDPSAVILRVP